MSKAITPCIINESTQSDTILDIPNHVMNKHPLMFHEPEDSIVNDMSYQYILQFFGTDKSYLPVSNDQIAHFVRNSDYIECAHNLLASTLNDPLAYGAFDIDDYTLTFDVPQKLLLKAMESLELLEKWSNSKATYIKNGGKIRKHYSKRLKCKFEKGGTVWVYFDPTADQTREARLAIKRSSMDQKSWIGFLNWLYHELGEAFMDSLVDANNTRVDIGLTIYGMPYIFLLVRDKATESVLYHKDPASSIPTSEKLNTSKDSNRFKTYDPSLYRLPSIGEGSRNLVLASSRVERQKFKSNSGDKKGGGGLTKFANLNNNRSQHSRLQFISPRIFGHVTKGLAIKLAKYKLNNVWKYVTDKEGEQLRELLDSGDFNLRMSKEKWRLCEQNYLSRLQREVAGGYGIRSLR